MARINLEPALIELEKWYDFKKIKPSKRITTIIDKKIVLKDDKEIPVIVEAIMQGELILEKDFSFKHKLNFPIGETKELIYKPRINAKTVNQKLHGVDGTNGNLLLNAYVAMLADENTHVIAGLDTEDLRTAQSVAIYFL